MTIFDTTDSSVTISTMSVKQYPCFQLPFDDSSVENWLDKFVAYRLHALQDAPESFTASYNDEVGRTRNEWKALLTTPAYRVILCVPSHEDTSLEPWSGDWAGVLLLHGPGQVQSSSPGAAYDIIWYTSGLYISRSHRAKQVPSRLFAAAVQITRVPRPADLLPDRHASQCRVKVYASILPWKTALIQYYTSMGLREVRQMRQIEYLSAWGLYPRPGTDEATDVLILEVPRTFAVKDNRSSHL